MSTKNEAIVLELGVNGLGVVRSLGKEGVPVTGIYTKSGPGIFSKYCKPLLFPEIAENEEEFKKRFIELCSTMDFPPVLFPTSDESLSFISRHREELRKCSIFTIPEADVTEKIINKDGTYELAAKCGVVVPNTYLPREADDIRRIANKIVFPVIFKPNDTFSVHLPNREKNIIFRSKEELLTFFGIYPHYAGRGILQEIIYGGDGYIYVCAAYLNPDSEPLAVYTGRKIRQYLPDYGITCYGESIYVPELEEITVDFMRQIKYRGLVAVEYSMDRKTGIYYFLEINGRSYYHNSLVLSCGINLPYTAYMDLINNGRFTIKKSLQKEGVKWIDFPRDAGSFWRKYKKGEIGIFEWLISVFQARSFGVFDFGDLKPFVYETFSLITVMAKKFYSIFR